MLKILKEIKMEKMLLFLLVNASFIGAMQPSKQAQPSIPVATITKIKNMNNRDMGVLIEDEHTGKRIHGPLIFAPKSVQAVNIPIYPSEVVTIVRKNFKYKPSGNTPRVYLILNEENSFVTADQPKQ